MPVVRLFRLLSTAISLLAITPPVRSVLPLIRIPNTSTVVDPENARCDAALSAAISQVQFFTTDFFPDAGFDQKARACQRTDSTHLNYIASRSGFTIPDTDLTLQFEAVNQFSKEEKHVVRELLEGLILKYEARRWE